MFFDSVYRNGEFQSDVDKLNALLSSGWKVIDRTFEDEGTNGNGEMIGEYHYKLERYSRK